MPPGVAFMQSVLLPGTQRVLHWGYTRADQSRVWNYATPAGSYLLPANQPAEVDTPKDDVAVTKRLWRVLPLARVATDSCAWLQPENDGLCYMQLRRLRGRIDRSTIHQAVEIRFLHDVIVVEDIVLKTDMRELLDDMRASAAKADNTDDASGDQGC